MHRHLRDTLDRIGENPYLFIYLQKLFNLGSFKQQVSAHICAVAEDSILDVGCGTGMYSTLAKGRYVGIDLNAAYIKYARSRYESGQKEFIVGDITKMNFGNEVFDKTLYVAMLHHFNEADNLRILEKISSITKKMVLMLDAVIPDKATFMQRLFLSAERGRYMRPLEHQLRIIKKVFKVKDVSIHFNRSKFGCCSIIECYPRRNEAQSLKIKE